MSSVRSAALAVNSHANARVSPSGIIGAQIAAALVSTFKSVVIASADCCGWFSRACECAISAWIKMTSSHAGRIAAIQQQQRLFCRLQRGAAAIQFVQRVAQVVRYPAPIVRKPSPFDNTRRLFPDRRKR
jgi:hypothetical protein